MATSKHVSFAEKQELYEADSGDDSDDSIGSFHEITTSEGESLCTSDEEDAARLEFLLKYRPVTDLDPAETSSLLFLDKDLVDPKALESEGDSSVVSELSSCVSGIGCATEESSTDESSDSSDDADAKPSKKRAKKDDDDERKKSGGRGSRGGQSQEGGESQRGRGRSDGRDRGRRGRAARGRGRGKGGTSASTQESREDEVKWTVHELQNSVGDEPQSIAANADNNCFRERGQSDQVVCRAERCGLPILYRGIARFYWYQYCNGTTEANRTARLLESSRNFIDTMVSGSYVKR